MEEPMNETNDRLERFRLFLRNNGFYIALVICLTMAVTVLCAKIVGCSLPMLAKRLGFDPAVMASPFITTIVDALSLLVYFGFASALLPALRAGTSPILTQVFDWIRMIAQ